MSKLTTKLKSKSEKWFLYSTAFMLPFLISACNSVLNQTAEERKILNMHRSKDTRTWRYPDEAEVRLAQTEARKRFGEFESAFSAWQPDKVDTKKETALTREECFEVKIPVTVLFATEHLWMRVKDIKKGTVTGVLDQSPSILKIYHEGSEFTVPREKIEDWTFGGNMKTTGGFTLIPLRRCKLQELNNIVLKDGQPTDDSVASCNLAWDQFWEKVSKVTEKDLEAMDKDNNEIVPDWWDDSNSLIMDINGAVTSNTNKDTLTKEELAEACGLPLHTIIDYEKIMAHITGLTKNASK